MDRVGVELMTCGFEDLLSLLEEQLLRQQYLEVCYPFLQTEKNHSKNKKYLVPFDR
jgi:hypothetical protein